MSGHHDDRSGHHDDRNGFNAAKIRWFESLLEENGLLAPGEVDDFLASYLKQANPNNGARIVARAWIDPAFRERLVADAPNAIRELKLVDPSDGEVTEEQHLKVVSNSPGKHNMIVCTLCSCYPLWLLGPSPSWYKNPWYRAEAVRNPRGVLREFGFEIPEPTEITVWDASSEMRYMVLPERPEGTDGMSEEELAELVTRNGLIGVAPH
ncbi:nitrile hydratase subunit alpha [Arthrobacter sp. B6]|uniref:nitrile hydratase subunit alpha n=1 Tax=Arthrobacter sp. B6 TaxID=1570137 RepID=UPI00082AD9E2|nr:nitrile hydratase subunit alpha [Arthrobacter sp. B6]